MPHLKECARVSQHEKTLTRARILSSAARLAREQGLEGASVNAVMKDAKLTHGGFYRHFSSKEDLLHAALDRAFAEIFNLMDDDLAAGRSPMEVMTDYQKFYLSDDHAAMPGRGCPVAAVGGDIGRASEALRQAFGAGVSRTIERLEAAMEGAADQRRTLAIRRFAMMAGAVMIARASDPDTARAVLEACRSSEA